MAHPLWLVEAPLALLAQVTPPAAPTATTTPSSVWDMVLKGGWTMIPLGLCSIVALTIIMDRIIMTRPKKVAPPALPGTLAGMRKNPRQALAHCAADGSPLATVLAAAIKGTTRELQEKQVREAGEREMVKLRKRMRLLSALPQTATMLGLLGTVLGMIRTFTVVAASGESLGKTEKLAQGIYEAWTATAAGLVIAIPVLVAYHMIMGRIDAAASALDLGAAKWLDGEVEAVVDGAPEAEAPAGAELAVAKA